MGVLCFVEVEEKVKQKAAAQCRATQHRGPKTAHQQDGVKQVSFAFGAAVPASLSRGLGLGRSPGRGRGPGPGKLYVVTWVWGLGLSLGLGLGMDFGFGCGF